ncbi:cation:proton antiporter [Mycolicibacterium komossense]|uniref:Cation:proton antiporter n=1 Tax=Mycolicibacterium komossense TaxID=1779 RepID=A0ABT3CM44_9MYCO|nr:cation:proton antiporter [Mycolicibacterium komossense]MCV7230593.1 cation:proton antiporter [Mycolicibacterium komossense]
MLLSLVLISLVVAGWALSAQRLDRWRITSPLFLVLTGAIVEYSTHGSLADTLNSDTAQHVAEIILAVLLFVDANEIRTGVLGERPHSAVRLLFIALPLAVGIAVALGLWLLPGMSLATVVVIACVVVPIDFAPARFIMRDKRVPSRVTDLLNVEAGYSDGIVSPVFVFALAVADPNEEAGSVWHQLTSAIPHAVIAIVIGVAIGAGLGLAANFAERKGLMTAQSKRIIVVAAPALTYTLSLWAEGNGFVAVFVCGIAYHYFRHSQEHERELELLDDISFLLMAAMWFVFGGVALLAYWRGGLTIGLVVFCLLALTLVRMLPMLVATLGSRFSWPERLLLGWLGPRGAATIVFGLLAFNVLDDPAETVILQTMVVVVLGSVLMHGIGARAAAHAFARSQSE